MFCSCRISTDKRVAQSLCNSRASCNAQVMLLWSDVNVSTGLFGLCTSATPWHRRITLCTVKGQRHSLWIYLHKSCMYIFCSSSCLYSSLSNKSLGIWCMSCLCLTSNFCFGSAEVLLCYARTTWWSISVKIEIFSTTAELYKKLSLR